MSTKFDELQLNRELRKSITIPPTEQVHCYVEMRLDPKDIPEQPNEFTEEQKMFAQTAIEFGESRIMPNREALNVLNKDLSLEIASIF